MDNTATRKWTKARCFSSIDTKPLSVQDKNTLFLPPFLCSLGRATFIEKWGFDSLGLSRSPERTGKEEGGSILSTSSPLSYFLCPGDRPTQPCAKTKPLGMLAERKRECVNTPGYSYFVELCIVWVTNP